MPMQTPNPGELRELIDIVNVVTPFSLTGAGVITAYQGTSIRAKIVPIGGSIGELDQGEKIAHQGYTIWIRYRAGVTPFQQIIWGSKRLTMTAPPEDFNKHWLLIHAQETTVCAV
jgi:head-tail adaptor